MYCDSVCSGKKNPKWSRETIKRKILVGFGSCLYHIIIHHILTILTSIHLNGTNLKDFDLLCFHTLLFCFNAFCQYYSCFVCRERERPLVRAEQQQPASLLSLSLFLSVHSVVFKMLLVGTSDDCQQASQDHQRQEQDPDGGCHHQCQLRWSRQLQIGLLLTRCTLLARWRHPAPENSTWTLKNHSISGSYVTLATICDHLSYW